MVYKGETKNSVSIADDDDDDDHQAQNLAACVK